MILEVNVKKMLYVFVFVDSKPCSLLSDVSVLSHLSISKLAQFLSLWPYLMHKLKFKDNTVNVSGIRVIILIRHQKAVHPCMNVLALWVLLYATIKCGQSTFSCLLFSLFFLQVPALHNLYIYLMMTIIDLLNTCEVYSSLTFYSWWPSYQQNSMKSKKSEWQQISK